MFTCCLNKGSGLFTLLEFPLFNKLFATNMRHAVVVVTILVSCLAATAAMAIPSPELVIGSVSSLSQILAIAFAAVTGSGAVAARKFGGGSSEKHSKVLIWVAFGFAMLSIALTAALIWESRSHANAELARLQSTLVRPAQLILDADLKETSYSAQEGHTLAITTSAAADLLGSTDTRFIDVRETGEHLMGTLPNASHIRYPDFLSSGAATRGQKIVLFCHNGNRSSETCEQLAALGIDCRFIAGGMEKWLVEGRGLNDQSIETLTDLRALPDFENKDTLLSTQDFESLRETTELQIIDARYPANFAAGHLPGAINIPIRALPTSDLQTRLASLRNAPTIAACYDRRSCFMSQVLGYELTRRGIPFLGRYTTPWEFFIPPAPKPHVAAWLADQNKTLWDQAIEQVARWMLWLATQSHFVVAVLALSLTSRLLVLPITLKSERDQILGAQHSDELKALKTALKHDPARKSRAIRQFYNRYGFTPARNMLGLLFLPLMMLGLSATEQAAQLSGSSALGLNLAAPDPLFILPAIGAVIAIAYLQWVVAKTRRATLLWWVLGLPITFALMTTLSAAGNLYLLISLGLLILQRCYVMGLISTLGHRIAMRFDRSPSLPKGVHLLNSPAVPDGLGNKAKRLAQMTAAGLPVPRALALSSDAVSDLLSLTHYSQDNLTATLWRSVGEQSCAVRSSGAAEDGADHSFAGVYESVLNVERQGLLAAIKSVAHSFHSSKAAAYGAEQDGSRGGNIVVQQMVNAEFAGVLFTQDPSSVGMVLVELVQGNGDDLVSGRATPLAYQFGRFSSQPVGNETPPIDLTPLLSMARDIEALFNGPQDIEWAYARGRFYILQSRDITATRSTDKSAAQVAKEWTRIFGTLQAHAPNVIAFEQDEMSEVLPMATPMSLSVIAQLWSPGGSLDLACRQLGLRYNLPEGRNAHLVQLFGHTYVDVALKKKLAVTMSRGKAKRLRKSAAKLRERFLSDTLPALRTEDARLKAINFAELPQDLLIDQIKTLAENFVQRAYVEAEKINILADFLNREIAHDRATQTPHAPVNLIARHRGPTGAELSDGLLAVMGHRATFDYELSQPRYSEDQQALVHLAASVDPSETQKPEGLSAQFQDLKEQAKHEVLRLYAHLRRALVALGQTIGLDDLIFYLRIEELDGRTLSDPNLGKVLQKRKDTQDHLTSQPPLPARLSLVDCERLTLPGKGQVDHSGHLSGTCVSGSGTKTGRVFVPDLSRRPQDAFNGFHDGDILVVRMIHPDWLPYVQRSNAVLSEIGGWLSHMSIVARECGVMMLVKCSGLQTLKTGDVVTVHDTGPIEVIADAQIDSAQ